MRCLMMLERRKFDIRAVILMGIVLAFAAGLLSSYPIAAQAQPAVPAPAAPLYETRANHDPNGTGKFYLGREIAQVMGPGGIPWLDRPERDSEEKPAEVIKAMKLR